MLGAAGVVEESCKPAEGPGLWKSAVSCKAEGPYNLCRTPQCWAHAIDFSIVGENEITKILTSLEVTL